MYYRTYKNVFRVRAELTSLSAGVGQKRIVLPEGWVITTDVIGLFFLSLPLFGFVVAPFPAYLINKILTVSTSQSYTTWTISLVASFALALFLSKRDPAGKTSLQYIWSIVQFGLRSSWSDGWVSKRINLAGSEEAITYLSHYENGHCGALPAKGYGLDRFEIHRPTAVRVSRRGKVEFSRRGTKLQPGRYQITNGKVVEYKRKKLTSW
ncbi:TcpE family conjugal transfer membrane protein [Paenibacillus sp. 1A_MP2]|uniref:TcpE family conjugal transfer membrane protein n=1 Tax=Paenibacillus sp. 1A_MP2 TaxID=3457495 RepID=UPI003FCE2C59